MGIHNFSNGHEPLYTTQRGLRIACKWLFDLLVFSPLVATGYFTATLMLDEGANGMLWLVITLIVAALMWLSIQQLKHWMIQLIARGNYLWLLVFMMMVSITCLLPAYLAYKPINYLVMSLHGKPIVAKLLDASFTLYVYYRYNFFNRR